MREIEAVVSSPWPSSDCTKKPKLNQQSVYIRRWKRASLLGVASPSLLAEGTCVSKRVESIIACGHSSDSVDGALFSSSQPWRPLHLLHRNMMQYMESIGIGASGLVQGTLGLLLVAGTLGLGARFLWQRASQIASMPRSYEAVLEFPFASGITIGTVVRIRGVEVGSVINVRPCLESIDAKVQVTDSSVYIPRNALVEVNQSGLVGETIIDITPMSPVPRPSVGPLDPGCSSEGLIVCNKEKIRGQQGVSIDDLIRLCGKMTQNSKDSDLKDFIKTADHMGAVVQNSKPLLEKVATLVGDVEPVVKELQDGRLVGDLTELLKLTTDTVHSLRQSSFTMENKRAVLASASNLATILKAVESTSEEIGTICKNEKNQKNLKHLIEILSRIVDDQV